MASFQAPRSKNIEQILELLITRQLLEIGINVERDQKELQRVLQQLPVAEFLSEIVKAGSRNASSGPSVDDVSAGQGATPKSLADAVEATVLNAPVSEAKAEASVVKADEVVVSPSGSEPGSQSVAGTAVPATPEPKAVGQPMYRLLIPNATADVAYNHQFDLSREPLAAFRIHSIAGLEDIGLTFDPENPRLHGTPRIEPGQALQKELEVVLVRWDNPAVRVEAILSLFINPNPHTLWKKIEPDASLEHRKAHRDSLCEAGPPMVLAASVRGRSHENSGAFREDDFHVGRTADEVWTVVAVSDGAGSAKLSRLGSQIATKTCVASLLAALEQESVGIEATLKEASSVEDSDERIDKLEDAGRNLLLEPVGRAAFAANKAIREKAAELGVEEKTLAATLMFAALRRVGDDVLAASYWIGDGAAALLDPASGWFRLLGEADGGEFSGQTRFLLSSEFPTPEKAWESIHKRFRSVVAPADAVLLLMTDGVSDPKFGTDNALREPARWLSFWNEDLAAQLPLSEPTDELGGKLEEYLQFWSKGDHDDRTLALVRWA